MINIVSIFFLIKLISISKCYFHGNETNIKFGATCREFLARNRLDSCCKGRDDECYMNHFDTRCYCDQFCSHRDCCPDVIKKNGINYCPEPEQKKYCLKNSKVYKEGEFFLDNCNRCRCRKGIFECRNKKCLINPELLEEINQNRIDWKAANYSFFWGKSLETGYLSYLGVTVPERKQKPMSPDQSSNLGNFYDFRQEKFFKNNYSNPIKNQGSCAASWAYSIVDVVIDRASKFAEKNLEKLPSVEHFISCNENNKNRNKCSSLSVDLAWSSLKHSEGIVDDECYPNSNVKYGYLTTCKMTKDSCPNKNSNKLIFHVSKAYPIVSLSRNIMNEILQNGPVQMVFRVYDDFFMYKSGVYSPSSKAKWYLEKYHAVKVIGWGTENGLDYWLAANSWGPEWGENGYFKIKRNSLQTEIGKYVYAAWVYT